MRRPPIAAALLAALLAAAPAPARADVTATQITAPADGLRLTDTDDATATVPVAGTATGAADDDVLNLVCRPRPGVQTTVGSVTGAGGAGAFTGTASFGSVRGPCVLAAVPPDFAPSDDPTPFTGPLVTVEAQRTVRVGDGPNAGTVRDVRDWLQGTAAGTGLCSLGSAGFCGGTLFDAASRRSTAEVFHAGGWVGPNTGSRSYLQVDGADAYPPERAAQLGPDLPGLPSVARTTVRGGDGGATVSESDPIVRCDTTTFPPGAACTALLDTGVRYDRTTTVAADGTTVEQHDVLVSTDGRAHTVSAYLGQTALVAPGVTPGLRFGWVPGDPGGARPAGTTVAGPASGPATLFVAANAAAPDGDPVYARGAVTFDRPPASVRVNGPNDAIVRMPDVRVPAGGQVDLVTATYVLGRTQAAVAAAARAREDAIVPPSVAITAPSPGATVLTPTVTVRGTASDNGGLPTVTVAGQPVAVAADGRFSATVPLAKGLNTIAAVATDAAGNARFAAVKVTYQDRIPPAVGLLSLNPRVWRVGRPTQLSFVLGEAGTLRLVATRPQGGLRNRLGACVAPTAALRRARARTCLRYTAVATAVLPVQAGVVRVAVGPKLGGRLVRAGRLRLSATVTDYARNASRPRLLDVTVRAALPKPR